MSWLSKSLKKVGKAIDKIDPTGITSFMTTGSKGGAVGKLLGAGVKKSESVAESTRYKRRKRNPWKSKRQKEFEKNQAGEYKPTKGKNKLSDLFGAGIKKNTTLLDAKVKHKSDTLDSLTASMAKNKSDIKDKKMKKRTLLMVGGNS